jgi:hypothetical protein
MPVDTVAQNIQLAVTPVFLLTAIGTMLAVLTSRLGRVVDRARQLEDELQSPSDNPERREIARTDLAVLDRRMAAVNTAIALCTTAALLVCIVIAILFIGELTMLGWTEAIIGLFLAAISLLALGLMFFLAEIRIALSTVRVRANLLAKEP